MEKYCHTQNYSLRYSDFDFKDELKPSALLALVQESACSSADELGFGYADLKPKGFGFIVVQTYCEILRPVVQGDRVSVETWPLPPRHVIFERDYRVKNGGGEICAALASRWCLVDLDGFAMLTPDKLGEANEKCPYNAEKSVEVPVWKIPRLGDGGKEVYRMRVLSGHCDHYMHANNTRYADFFFDCFTMEELSARKVSSFQIAYGKQAKEGAELILFRKDFEDGSSVCEARSGGETLAQFKAVFADKNI